MADNTYIINPNTGRSILKGGTIHKKLIKAGKLPNDGFQKPKKATKTQKLDSKKVDIKIEEPKKVTKKRPVKVGQKKKEKLDDKANIQQETNDQLKI